MNEAIAESRENAKNNYQSGGPFGAVIVKNGEIIARGHNTVIETKDPTAHAEVNTIRAAAKALSTHDLTGCTLYVNAEPCPMCLSAIIWANIKEVYYATDLKDAEDIGFRDDYIYNYIKGNNKDLLKITQIDRDNAIKLFEEYKEKNKEIY
jgi:tRNA(Arg) A34 adenosine deaminase TadA